MAVLRAVRATAVRDAWPASTADCNLGQLTICFPEHMNHKK